MVRKISSKPPVVTYHVGDLPQASPVRAATPRQARVQEASAPRAAKTRPIQLNKPARSTEGRLSILSPRSFTRLAVCMLGVIHGASAQHQVGMGPASFPTANLDEPAGGLDDAIGLLSEMGVEVFYVAQGEGDQASLSSMNAVLQGLVGNGGSGWLLQQDVPKPSVAHTGVPSISEFDRAISKNVDQMGDDPHARFADLLKSRKIKPVPISRNPEARSYLGEVVGGARAGTVVGLSKEFAFYLHAGPNMMRFPGRTETVPVPKVYQLSESMLPQQDETYGLFQASSQARPTALIVTTQVMRPEEVEELWDHFKHQFTVCMVPLEDDVQAMIVAPFDARPGLLGLREQLEERGIGPVKLQPATSLHQHLHENKFVLGNGVMAPGLPEDLTDRSVDQLSWLDALLLTMGASAIGGACVLVYRCVRGGAVPAHAPQVPKKTGRSRHLVQGGQSDNGTARPFEGKPVSYIGAAKGALLPPTPDDVAASIAKSIREIQADKENGKAGLKRYLQQKGAEFRALLDPVTGGGAQAAADVAFQLSGIIESTLLNPEQMRRWLEGEDFMDGVYFESVLQTVKDYKQTEPQNESLAKAVAMLQGYWRLVPRGDPDEVEYKGRQGPAPRPGSARPRNRLQNANAANASDGAATPSQVTIADIFAFGRKLVAEVKDGGDVHGVRIGRDIYIPSAVVVPHWHLNEDFVVYKHSDTNHVEVARGSNVYPERAGSVGMRLDDTISRDHQLLRIQAFILTGNENA